MSGKGRTVKIQKVTPIFNTTTGEHIGDGVDDQEVRVGRAVPKAKREPFMMLTQRSMAKLDLTASQWRVLMLLGSRRDRATMESRILVREMADMLNMQAPNVSRCLIDLAERRIIFKFGNGVYRISNHIAYAGDNVSAQIAADPEPIWEREGHV